LGTFAWNPRHSWQSHAFCLDRVKGHINAVGERLAELQQIRYTVLPWQQQAITEVTSHAAQVATSTQAAIVHLRENQDRLFASEYRDHLTTIEGRSGDMKQTVDKFLDYEKAQQKFQRLQNELELAGDLMPSGCRRDQWGNRPLSRLRSTEITAPFRETNRHGSPTSATERMMVPNLKRRSVVPEIGIAKVRKLPRIATVALGWILLLGGIAGLLLPIVPGGLLIVVGALMLRPHCASLRRALENCQVRFPALERAFRRLSARGESR
jgi:hypothetical protein